MDKVQSGDGDSTKGSTETPTLVLLSGLLCDDSVWHAQKQALGGMADLIVLYFPDHDSIEGMADHVLASAPARFALAGHSMGARVALELIRKAPERVDRLALLNTGIHPVRPGEAEKRQELVDLAYREGMRALAEQWLPPMLAPERVNDRAIVEPLMEMVCRATPRGFERQIMALLTRPDASLHLGEIQCPTLLASGRQDGWSPLAQHVEMASIIPHNTLVPIENSGHFSLVEQPQTVSDMLAVWLTARN